MLEYLRELFSLPEDKEVEYSLSSRSSSVDLGDQLVVELEEVGAPLLLGLRGRRNSVVGTDGVDHKITRTDTVTLPQDHVHYQENAKKRVLDKLDSWKIEVKDGEPVPPLNVKLDGLKTMFNEDGGMSQGVIDTEEFIDSVRGYLDAPKIDGVKYSEKEETANTAANDFSKLLLNKKALYKKEAKATVLEKLKAMQDAIAEVEDPRALRWQGIKASLDELYDKISQQEKVWGEDALKLDSLIANWPPSLNKQLLEHKSRVNTKILIRPKEMDLFEMPIDDLVLREKSKTELEALNKAITKAHSVKGQTVILKLGDINDTINIFRAYNKELSDDKKPVHIQYGKDLDVFVTVLNSLKNEDTDGSSDKFKRQVSSENFQNAAKAFKATLENQNPKLDKVDAIITALTGIIGDFSAKGGTKRVETAYKALVKAIQEGPVTLSVNVLVLVKAREQSKHKKDMAWYRDDLFATAKGLADGCALIFQELNEYHKYINELNNFVLSLITVDGPETEEALKARSAMLKKLSIEELEGSVNDITQWQSDRKTERAIKDIRAAMGNIKGTEIPKALETTMDALTGFKSAFDPISGRNFTKGSTEINGVKVATADRNTDYDNPLNPSNGKEASKGIAIMKGSVDTLVALKKLVGEFTKAPATETLARTIDLCEKWSNAILNLAFEKDLAILTKNMELLSNNPTISTPPIKEEVREFTIEELEATGGFSITSFKNTLKQMLVEYVEQSFGQKKFERTYGLNFGELLKYIDTDLRTPEKIDADYKTRKLEVQYVNNTIGQVQTGSYNAILEAFKKRYDKRMDDELKWREQSSGKASRIASADDFNKKKPITTFKHIKEGNNAKIDYYVDELSSLQGQISKSTGDMKVAIFLKNVSPSQFDVFANAKTKEAIENGEDKYPSTYQNLLEKGETGALPTTLHSMKTTAKIADGIDVLSSSFVQIGRLLTDILPDKDMKEELFQVKAQKAKAVIDFIGTAGSTAASITAAFVGPMAPIPLLVGGIFKGLTSAVNAIIDNRIKASQARMHLEKFIGILEAGIKSLQAERDKVSGHRTKLQGWLSTILSAIANINQHVAVEV